MTRMGILTCIVAAAAPHRLALAAPSSVEAFAGAVGGVENVNVPGVCSTYIAPEPESSFFPTTLEMAVPHGGIAACGYSGDAGSTTSAGIGRDGKRNMLGRELQKRSPVRQRLGDRDGAEGDVDGPGLLRDGVHVLFHRLLVEGIDLRCLGDSAAADTSVAT